MFTGLVERTHKIAALEPSSEGIRLHLEKQAVSAINGDLTPWNDLLCGESIAVNGACLTLVEEGDTLAFDVIHETLRKTSIQQLRPAGDKQYFKRHKYRKQQIPNSYQIVKAALIPSTTRISQPAPLTASTIPSHTQTTKASIQLRKNRKH